MLARYAPYLAFILIMMAVGFTAAYFSVPGAWYQGLNKAWFNPPNWVFGPAWTFLYVLIGISGGIVWKWDRQSVAMKLWWLQLILNGFWSIAFFAMERPTLALFIVVLLLLSILLFIRCAEEAKPARLLFTPYLFWVGFATLLNASIVALN